MDDPAISTGTPPDDGLGSAARHYNRNFWRQENLKFTEPHFRLEKCAQIVNRIAGGNERDLLDVGCGPAALMHLLRENIHYYGIDIAIHDQAPNLLEADFMEAAIKFADKKFDIVLAQGIFEYLGRLQSQKFAEISDLLARDGKFIVSYWNFGHTNKHVYEAFSNIQPIKEFRRSLSAYFSIEKSFPVGHNWHHHEPGRKLVKTAQMHLDVNIPLISPAFAVEYLFICSSK